MAVCSWYLVKRDLTSQRYYTIEYTSVTSYKVPEKHSHAHLVRLYLGQVLIYEYFTGTAMESLMFQNRCEMKLSYFLPLSKINLYFNCKKRNFIVIIKVKFT